MQWALSPAPASSQNSDLVEMSPLKSSRGGAMTLRLQQPGGATGPVANWGRGQLRPAGSTPPRQAPWGLWEDRLAVGS